MQLHNCTPESLCQWPWRHTAEHWDESLPHPTHAGVVIPSKILKTMLCAFFIQNFIPQLSTVRSNLSKLLKGKVTCLFCCAWSLHFCFTISLLINQSISMYFRQKVDPHIMYNWKLLCYPKTVCPTLSILAKVKTYFLTSINPIQESKLLKWCLRNQGACQTAAVITFSEKQSAVAESNENVQHSLYSSCSNLPFWFLPLTCWLS